MISLECKTLEKVKLLRNIDPRRLQLVAMVADRVSYLANETIFERGSVSDAVYIVLQGEADLMTLCPEGNEILLDRVGEGHTFGEIGVLNDIPRPISVVAHTDTCLLRIPKADFLELARDLPEFALSVMRDLAGRITGLVHRQAAIGCI